MIAWGVPRARPAFQPAATTKGVTAAECGQATCTGMALLILAT